MEKLSELEKLFSSASCEVVTSEVVREAEVEDELLRLFTHQ